MPRLPRVVVSGLVDRILAEILRVQWGPEARGHIDASEFVAEEKHGKAGTRLALWPLAQSVVLPGSVDFATILHGTGSESPGERAEAARPGESRHGFGVVALSSGRRGPGGKSATTSNGRDAFKRIVEDVSVGEGGIVIGLEIARLARNCADFFPMIEMCALTRMSIADEEGVRSNEPNDRLGARSDGDAVGGGEG